MYYQLYIVTIKQTVSDSYSYYKWSEIRLGKQARVQGGGPKGPRPPPLEIEKQKKKKKRSSEQILSYFTYILLLF